jgi:hypothetical protein
MAEWENDNSDDENYNLFFPEQSKSLSRFSAMPWRRPSVLCEEQAKSALRSQTAGKQDILKHEYLHA